MCRIVTCDELNELCEDPNFCVVCLSTKDEVDNVVSTGHIASTDGDIRMVSSIPTKLSAAVKNKSVRTFIYPGIDQDDSLDSLSPQQKSQIAGALAKAKKNLLVVSVRNVKDVSVYINPKNYKITANKI